jgi:hypothetical protein
MATRPANLVSSANVFVESDLQVTDELNSDRADSEYQDL